MNREIKKYSIPGLRWALGLVILWEAARFVFSAASAHYLSKRGMPPWIRPALGGTEIVAAVLFLAPAVNWIGGYLLLFIFAIAAVLHVLHGEFDVGVLIVYAMGVIVCMAYFEEERGRTNE